MRSAQHVAQRDALLLTGASAAGEVAADLRRTPPEKSLQALIEKDPETFFGVRLLAGEYVTSKEHGGRMSDVSMPAMPG